MDKAKGMAINPNITLGEVKAHCNEMFAKYADECCDHCDYTDMGCCDAPSDWKLDDTPNDGEKVCDGCQTDWEEMYQIAYREREECRVHANAVEAENAKLRTIVRTVEAMLGRRIDI